MNEWRKGKERKKGKEEQANEQRTRKGRARTRKRTRRTRQDDWLTKEQEEKGNIIRARKWTNEEKGKGER